MQPQGSIQHSKKNSNAVKNDNKVNAANLSKQPTQNFNSNVPLKRADSTSPSNAFKK